MKRKVMKRKDCLGEYGCCLVCIECGTCRVLCEDCLCVECTCYYYSDEEWRGKCYYLEFKQKKIWFDNFEIVRETKKAVLVRSYNKTTWLPKSQITLRKRKDKTKIGIPAWLCEKSGLVTDGWFALDDMTIEEYERAHFTEIYDRFGNIFDRTTGRKKHKIKESNYFGDLRVYRAFNGGSKLVENVCKEKGACKVCGEERFLPYLLHFGDCYAEVCSDCVKKLNDQVVMEVREKTKRGWATSN